MEYIVTEQQAGQRLDVYLAEVMQTSRSKATLAIKADYVHVNGRTSKPSALVVIEDRILFTPQTTHGLPVAEIPDLPVLYEDDDLLVIDKPAGIAVHASSATDIKPTVADFSRTVSTDPDPERPGIVHRLDRDTSGLLIIAKNEKAKKYLQLQFKNRKVVKHYTALVVGRLKTEAAVIKLAIGRDKKLPTRRAIDTTGKPATTAYRRQASYPGFTLIEAYPQTGRTHQLRLHFAAIGHPIAGDSLYGFGKPPQGLSRQFLHATQLDFTSPNGSAVHVVSPLPADLFAVLKALSD